VRLAKMTDLAAGRRGVDVGVGLVVVVLAVAVAVDQAVAGPISRWGWG
jgi:hypothetical protein